VGGAAVAEVEGLEGGIGQSGALEFLGIDNIHVMRDSEKKLKDICNHLSVQDKGWLTALDNSRYRTSARHTTRHTLLHTFRSGD
jgi:predicted MarR family transcription regulator